MSEVNTIEFKVDDLKLALETLNEAHNSLCSVAFNNDDTEDINLIAIGVRVGVAGEKILQVRKVLDLRLSQLESKEKD